MFIEKDPKVPYSQAKSIGVRYINNFAIDEHNQFEIDFIHDPGDSVWTPDYNIKICKKIETGMQTVAKISQHQKEGPE